MTKVIKRATKKTLAVLLFGAMPLVVMPGALADEWPLGAGDYWEVTGIDVKDGGDFKYAEWLATEWRKDAEFAKSKGWIKDAIVLYNVYGQGDADIYLIRIIENVPAGEEFEKRGQEYQEWKQRTFEKLVGESGNRAEFREVLRTSLLQHAPFRD